MKPKQALVKDGFLPPGSENKRGRMSAAAIARCEELVAAGWKIEGFESVKPVSVSTDKPTTEVKRVSVDPNRLVDVPDALRSDKDFTLVRKDTGKPIHAVGMRNVCEGCGSSFTYCPCPSPTFLDNTGRVPVEFRMKKGGA
jgi:hypothetical protein